MDPANLSLENHKRLRGKTALHVKSPIRTRDDLSWAYTPGVAAPCRAIAKNPEEVWTYTARGNWVAVITDGSAVLGLGNIGPLAALPVMEGKCVLLKEFGNVDAFPICLATQDTEEIIQTVKRLAPSFGGINLEDISAPRCFEIERRLDAELDIPVFHDDQHGTAIVVTAGLINACTVTGHTLADCSIVINGAGAAGMAIANMLTEFGVHEIVLCDRTGIISCKRPDLTKTKQDLAERTNPNDKNGLLADAVKGADILIGVSAPKTFTQEMIRSMKKDGIVFALSNPDPEIFPDDAKSAGAAVVATGRSDFPNQVNNVLAFPGIFRGALDARIRSITPAMKQAAALALANFVQKPTTERILPEVMEKGVAEAVAGVIR